MLRFILLGKLDFKHKAVYYSPDLAKLRTGTNELALGASIKSATDIYS